MIPKCKYFMYPGSCQIIQCLFSFTYISPCNVLVNGKKHKIRAFLSHIVHGHIG